jgi:hypothetical protein
VGTVTSILYTEHTHPRYPREFYVQGTDTIDGQPGNGVFMEISGEESGGSIDLDAEEARRLRDWLTAWLEETP